MKKIYFIIGTLAITLCTIVLCAFATNNDTKTPEVAA